MPELRLDVTADSAVAVSSLEGVGTAARGAAADVDTAASSMDTAAGRMDGLAESGDVAASKASQATGAFGALAGGLEAAGFESAALGLQGVAVATDFASGAGDLLNLVMDTQAVRFVVAKAQALGHAVATGAQTAATATATGAQWALNAALSANPIGVVIALVVALAAGIVIAYNKSETFREIVHASMDKAREAVGWVVDRVEDAVEWVGKAQDGWDKIQTAAESAMEPVENAVGDVSDALETAVGWVEDLIGWIGRIDFPEPPGWLSTLADVVPRGAFVPGAEGPGLGLGGKFDVTLNLNAARQDQDLAMSELVQALTDHFARRNLRLSITEATA